MKNADTVQSHSFHSGVESRVATGQKRSHRSLEIDSVFLSGHMAVKRCHDAGSGFQEGEIEAWMRLPCEILVEAGFPRGNKQCRIRGIAFEPPVQTFAG